MISRVSVVCDSPQHPGGRVSTVAVYRRFPSGWEREFSFRKAPKRTHAQEKRQRRFLEAADPAALAEALAADTREPACPYCATPLAVSRLRLETELERAASSGVSTVTVCQLQQVS